MATTVTVGGVAATDVTVASATSLTAVVPAGTAGDTVDIVVSTSTDTATLADAYTYISTTPVLTSVTPQIYAGSASAVTFTGQNLPGPTGRVLALLDADDNIIVSGTSTSSSTTSLFTTIRFPKSGVPVGTYTGAILVDDVVVLRLDDSTTVVEVADPTATSVTPNPVAPTIRVTVTGTGFVSGPGWFGYFTPVAGGSTTPQQATRTNDTTVTVTVPGALVVGTDYNLVIAGASAITVGDDDWMQTADPLVLTIQQATPTFDDPEIPEES